MSESIWNSNLKEWLSRLILFFLLDHSLLIFFWGAHLSNPNLAIPLTEYLKHITVNPLSTVFNIQYFLKSSYFRDKYYWKITVLFHVILSFSPQLETMKPPRHICTVYYEFLISFRLRIPKLKTLTNLTGSCQ